MKIFRSLNEGEALANPVLTIGNYDGIHVGHRHIISKVLSKAREISGTPMLMTFHPHPLTMLRPDAEVHLITPLEQKERLLAEAGIEVLWVLPFDDTFRSIDAEEFVGDILVGKLQIKALIIGYDFKFGRGGLGNVELLSRLSGDYGFAFEVVSSVTIDGEKVGSNRIRRMIAEGNVEKAARFLGRPYMIEGTVARGKGRGAVIGFPTVNLATDFDLIPARGVYMTEVEIKDQGAGGTAHSGERRFPAVTNVGYNPTFGGERLSIETHLLDFTGDLYGHGLAVHFLKKVRDEIKFSCVDALSEQIAFDVRMAREFFAAAGRP
jgi:riboflavin kinase / FMN adenylyltransferase